MAHISRIFFLHNRRHYVIVSLVFGLLLTLTCQAKNAGTLSFSEDFDVLAANGQLYNNAFRTGDRIIPIRSGINRFILRYEVVIDGDDDDEFDVVKSPPILIEVYLQQNKNYRQSYLKPANLKAAKAFSRHPQMTLLDESNKPVKHSWRFVENDDEAVLIQLTRVGLTHAKPTIDLSPSAENKSMKQSQQLPTALSMLEYWWQQASDEEKESFLAKHTK